MQDMPIFSVIFMDWISFLFHIAIQTVGRNLISTNAVPSLTIQPPTTPALYTGPHLRHCISTPGTYGHLQHTMLQHGTTRFSIQPSLPLVFTKTAVFPSTTMPYIWTIPTSKANGSSLVLLWTLPGSLHAGQRNSWMPSLSACVILLHCALPSSGPQDLCAGSIFYSLLLLDIMLLYAFMLAFGHRH